MIEDKELRDLFKAESAEHLQKLDDGLLRLEKEPNNQAALEEVFREAHSLKGAARMLGLNDIETLSHRLEDMFGAAKKGEAALTPETIDGMYKTLDAVKGLVHEATSSAEFGVQSAELKEKSGEAWEKLSLRGEAEAIPTPVTDTAIPKAEIAAPSGLAMTAFKIETVRVDTHKLDVLMTQVGELTVTKLRIARRADEIEEIIGLWEELNKHSALSIPHLIILSHQHKSLQQTSCSL